MRLVDALRRGHLASRARAKVVRLARNRWPGLVASLHGIGYEQVRGTLAGVRARAVDCRRWAPQGDHWPSVIASLDDSERACVIDQARQVLRHEFDLLGTGSVALGPCIPWNTDYRSGHRWQRGRHYEVKSIQALPAGVDIKMPWELSRCQHLPRLALADLIAPDDRYWLEFKAQVLHWIAENPVDRGANWMCAMDVGIRVINWITALQMFQERVQGDRDEAFLRGIDRAIWDAGRHIRANLEWGGPELPRAGNHFLANLAGLIGAGLYFQDRAGCREWLEFGSHWIDIETLRQVNADGTNFESSIPYHRLVMELLVWSHCVRDRAGIAPLAAAGDRIRRMAEFVDAYMDPAGNASQIGDNDSGRLLCVVPQSERDHRYLVGRADDVHRLDSVMFGIVARHDPLTPSRGPVVRRVFPDGGYAFLQDGTTWVGLRAGAVVPPGAHAHCDQLSIVASIKGVPVLVDRGTGCYTPRPGVRNTLRSTKSHNVMLVNGWEQAAIDTSPDELFRLDDQAQAGIEDPPGDQAACIMRAAHLAYDRHRSGMRMTRVVRLDCDAIELVDSVESLVEGDELEWRFHAPPGAVVVADPDGTRIEVGPLAVVFTPGQPLAARVEPSLHSDRYGEWCTAATLVLRGHATQSGRGEFRLRLTFRPG